MSPVPFGVVDSIKEWRPAMIISGATIAIEAMIGCFRIVAPGYVIGIPKFRTIKHP